MRKELPGGRRLWCQLVVGFFGVAVLGAIFVSLGAVFMKKAHKMAVEDSMSLPLVWCIIGIGECFGIPMLHMISYSQSVVP
jgi:hypothetical protein